ncbi:MAG: YvcK family protein [Syntrophomonadaceae bacterium]|nr:YvcK family protein [Syntrophomonadaceae bacterium]
MKNSTRELSDAIKLDLKKKRGPRIVVIGGGTGLSVLLKGLKEYSHNITAVVAVTDDGGSSGRIREMGLLPPGDIRRCLVALAQTETLMDQVFQHRFQEGDGIAGHNLGNLLIAALTNITGDFVGAIKEVSKVLAVQGRVLPATTQLVTLGAIMEDDTVVMGETSITGAGQAVKEIFLVPPDCQVLPEALEAIEGAEAIILGPGSLYTSIITNLLVPEIGNAIRSTKATTILVANIMTQPGETTGYSVSDHLEAVSHHIGPGYIDYVVVNDAPIDEERLARYSQEGSEPVKFDSSDLAVRGVNLVCDSLLGKDDVAWHDPEALARTIMRIVYREKGLAV